MVNLTPQTISVVTRGTRLKNGATVLEGSSIHEPGDGFIAHGIVLCVTAQGQYVTWSFRLHDMHTSSGEYFNDIASSLTNYRERCEGKRLNHFLDL